MAATQRVVSDAELAQHSTPEDGWVRIGNRVLDITDFAAMHPGGEQVLARFAGRDASEAFFALHRADVLDTWGPKLHVGVIEGPEEVGSTRVVLGWS